MTTVIKLDPAAATLEAQRRHAGAQTARPAAAHVAPKAAASRAEPIAGPPADVFAAHLQRAMPGAVAARLDAALDAPGAHSSALAAQDRLASQILSIANVAGGRVASLLGD